MIAQTPKPPYYAVIFSSIRSTKDEVAYKKMAELMTDLAHKQDGFLGIENSRESLGITVSYWKNLDAIKRWKNHYQHRIAQELGRSKWYVKYKTRIAKVERDYEFTPN